MGELKFEMVAKTFLGLEEVLESELIELGAENVKVQNRAVTFNGNKAMMYKANYCLRTALSVLKPVTSFVATNEDELYAKVQETNWSEIMNLKQTFAVETTVHSEIFKHSQYAGLKCKDAIADQFRNMFDKRPFVDVENPDILINVHISDKQVNISLNSSGEPLYKRGYRAASVDAPLNEVLAAGLIKMSGWKGETDFIDPMCGSGTLLIEAALISENVAPGIYRKKYAFENWLDFDAELLQSVVDEAAENESECEAEIYGYDISPKAIGITRTNLKNAFLSNKITLEVKDFNELDAPSDGGVLITNPPYGERLRPDDIDLMYKNLGSRLKHKFTNFDAWILTANKEALKNIGLHSSKKIKLVNGALECTFTKYELFEGSKKNQFSK